MRERLWIGVAVVLGGAALALATACGSSSPRPSASRRPPPRPPAPVVTAGDPPSPCASLPEQMPASALFDAFFRAHAEGRIDPELVDAHGGPVPQAPLATELVCPVRAEALGEQAADRGRVALRLRAGADTIDTEALVSRSGDRDRIAVESLARIRGDLQAHLLRRLLADHPEIEQLAVIDVPFEDDFPDPSGVSPRQRTRAGENLRLAFARLPDETVLCLLRSRAERSSSRSWCWREDARLDRVVVGAPMIVDETIQVQLLMVAVAPAGRAEVVELRFPGLEVRRVGAVRATPAPIVPCWDGRAREGVVLEGTLRPRPGPWAALTAVEEPPPWLGVLAAAPWLRATPVPSPADRAAASITADIEETRRWLAVHTATGWAFSDAPLRSGPDGVTSWDGVEPAEVLVGEPDGTFVAWSSDFAGGRGAAHLRLLHADGHRLVEQAALTVGLARAWWRGEEPEDPVAARLGVVGPASDVVGRGGPRHRVAWRARWAASRAGAPGCIRLRRTRADVAHVTRDFQPVAGRPALPFDPAAPPPALQLGELPDTTGVYLRRPEQGFAAASACE